MQFDYIIVGAGSAGCVLAHRLSEDAGRSVLLLEAGGPDDRAEIHVPLGFSRLFRSPLDWTYETEPQPHLSGRRLYWPRGKVLGGSSSINAQIYIRGHRSIYDGWAARGNAGWGWDELLPYFLRAEHQERGASALHGVSGPLNVADLRELNPISATFLAACAELGLPANDDFNGPEQVGFGRYQVTQKDGQRCSVVVAYLRLALGRPNLTVATETLATQVLFEGRRAVGIRYERDGRLHEARASADVILAGGAINSPHLLMLSGVGPADALARHGIPVVCDLPGVGQNLQDHAIVSVAYRCREPISLANATEPEAIAQYAMNGTGPLSSNGGEVGGFISTRPGLVAPDLQFMFNAAWYFDHGFTVPEGHGFTFGPARQLPQSHGEITLRSADPHVPPAIQPRYFETAADADVLLAGVKLAREIAQPRAFARLAGPEHTPGPTAQTDEQLRAFIRDTAETVYHPCDTCRMGTDPLAVVDPTLRVHGVDGLRVVDASVIPSIVNGNLNAPTIAIAEKAADLIRGVEPLTATSRGDATLGAGLLR